MILAETAILMAPTFFAMVFGLILLPHQLFLFANHPNKDSLIVIGYYIGIYLGFLPFCYAIYLLLNKKKPSICKWFIFVGFFVFIISLAAGPYGVFSPHGSLPIGVTIPFSIMPLICVLHIFYLMVSEKSE
ncbi:hypothetical protein [Microbulbifer sp.]|uniref:hypothetical protein n=1 Tax=Microbulbifer sp. TaxID=1908541 RepID=UPI003F2FC68B